MERRARMSGVFVTVCSTQAAPDRQLDAVRLLRSLRPRALVLASSRFGAGELDSRLLAELHAYERDGGRVVVVGVTHGSFDSIAFDNHGAGRLVGEHIAGTGHRRVTILAGPAERVNFSGRVAGMVEGLRAGGVQPRHIRIAYGEAGRQGGFDAARELPAGHRDAVLAVNDVIAIGALSALRAAGVAVPGDVSVTGIDDIQLAVDVTPRLTTVGLPLAHVGAESIRLALREQDRARTPHRTRPPDHQGKHPPLSALCGARTCAPGGVAGRLRAALSGGVVRDEIRPVSALTVARGGGQTAEYVFPAFEGSYVSTPLPDRDRRHRWDRHRTRTGPGPLRRAGRPRRRGRRGPRPSPDLRRHVERAAHLRRPDRAAPGGGGGPGPPVHPALAARATGPGVPGGRGHRADGEAAHALPRRARHPDRGRAPLHRPRRHRLPAPVRRRRRPAARGCWTPASSAAPCWPPASPSGTATRPTSPSRGAAPGSPKAAGPPWATASTSSTCCFSVLGPWQEVSAMAARQARDTETEDVSMALVTFDNGAMATVVNSVLSPRETSVLRFDFERATVEVEHLYGYSDDDWTITPAPGHEKVAELWAARPRRRAEQPRRPVRRGPGRARPGRGAARHAGGGPADDGVRRRRLRLRLHRQARPQRGSSAPAAPSPSGWTGRAPPGRPLRAKRASDDPTLQATHALGRSVAVTAGDVELFTYIYRPDTPGWSRPSPTCTRSAP